MKNGPARLLSEFIGVFFLCGFGIGAITNDAGLLGVALAHGIAIFIAISAFGHISGGHFNPAVTIALAATKRISPKDAGAYIVAQLLGGALAALIPQLAYGSFKGVPALGGNTTVSTGILMEALATFILMITIMGVAVDKNGGFGVVGGLPIGLSITGGIMTIGPATGAALNPARWFGPALVAGDMSNALVWIVGPILGALLAAFLYDSVIKPARA
ncbi:MAG: aquaporin [Actinomycetes bacterium]